MNQFGYHMLLISLLGLFLSYLAKKMQDYLPQNLKILGGGIALTSLIALPVSLVMMVW